jgi:beta-glucanase (GH16 family)
MRYVLLFLILLVSPALGQTTLAPFADPTNCPGLTYQLNGTQGWNYGGTSDGLYDGNGSFASNQASSPTPAVSAEGSGLNVGVVQTGNGLQGAMINTHHQFSQTYGYWEVNATLKDNVLQPGITTSVWLMPENGGWPPEIDIEETAGVNSDTAVHACAGCGSAVSNQYNIPPGKHVWAVDWNPQNITFYIDGNVPTNPDNGQPATTPTPDNFRQPMYMVIDAMSQGATGSMQIDTIRVYKDMQSALACVPQASSSPPPQLAALNNQIQQVTSQADQLKATIPAMPVARSLPQMPPPVAQPAPAPAIQTQFTGYNPQFTQYGQQAQQQLQSIQSQIDGRQSQIQNFTMPTASGLADQTAMPGNLPAPPPQATQQTAPTAKAKARHHHDADNDGDADDQ